MKRGFLLRTEEAATKRRAAQKQTEFSASSTPAEPRSVPQHLKDEGPNVDKKGNVVENLAHGKLSEEGKALPSDYKSKVSYSEFDPFATEFSEDGPVRLVTTIPQPALHGEIQCEWIVHGPTKAKVFNAPGYPARIPKPCRPDLYEVRSTPDMGEGLFTKRNIKRGDLILAERPLLVYPLAMIPLSQVVKFEYEKLLECTVARFSSESQADFRALHNAHSDNGGPLLGITRTNGYGIINLYDGSVKSASGRYGAVCKIGSRINHSFTRYEISKPENNSYCEPGSNLAQRQAETAPYGFVCRCPACVNATPESDKLRNTFRKQIMLFRNTLESSSGLDETAVEDAVGLEKDMVKEGLDADSQFVELLTVIYLAYTKLGKVEESKKYCALLEAFRNCFIV